VRKIRDFLKAFIGNVKAYTYMRSRLGCASWKMADSLHKTFGAWHPHDAIDEDLGYWG
jgi:hypothetical protein